MTRGEDAERLVTERLRAALPPEYRLYPNVEWTGPMRDGDRPRTARQRSQHQLVRKLESLPTWPERPGRPTT
jgi:hypothetical protein